MLSEVKSYKNNWPNKLEVCLLTFTFSHQRDANERQCCWDSCLVSDKLAKVECQAFTCHNSTKIYMNILLLLRYLSMTKAFTWKNRVEMKQISESSRKRQFSDRSLLFAVCQRRKNQPRMNSVLSLYQHAISAFLPSAQPFLKGKSSSEVFL